MISTSLHRGSGKLIYLLTQNLLKSVVGGRPHRSCCASVVRTIQTTVRTDICKKSNNSSLTSATMATEFKESKESLKKRLTALQYQVTQEAGTERPHTGCYDKHYEKGVYTCIVCSQELFSSDTKYDSGCGWPAFNDVLDKGKITLHRDASIAGGNILLIIKHPERIRTEVRCAKCGAHMGHVFEDGPAPTRKRYCINSASINFIEGKAMSS